ncbi:MAG TPA: RDD family protein [Pyrinomonadaceae bacterium]
MALIGDASKGRIAAFIIDNLLACVVSLLAVAALDTDNPVIAGPTLCLAYLGYFFLFESALSTTPGKFLHGLVVRKIDGTKCGVREHAIRALVRMFEANPLLFGGLPAGMAIFASERKQRIGDSLAGTVVISKKALAAESEPIN